MKRLVVVRRSLSLPRARNVRKLKLVQRQQEPEMCRPITAPINGKTADFITEEAATRNTLVSNPSLSTARKAMTARLEVPAVLSAAADFP